MNLLITKQDVSSYLQTAIGIPDNIFNNYIYEAQEFDLKYLLCEDMYFDLLKNSTDQKYIDLINGKEYTYENKSYSFSGLGKVIAYFTYARFILKSNIVSTSHGFVVKNTQFSETVPLDERRVFYHNYRKEANIIFDDVKKFIERNNSIYPKCELNCSGTKIKTFNTRVIQ